MSIEKLLDHTCDIYHIVKGDGSPGYNLPSSPTHTYPKDPDLSNVPCHFGVDSRNVTITQTQPAAIMEAKIKLTLPTGTDIRLNDKIVDNGSGLSYTAESPRNIRGHHLYVYLRRTEAQQPL